MERGGAIEYLVLGLAALFIGVSKAGFGGGTGILVTPLLAWMYNDSKFSVALQLPWLLACDIISLFFFWRKWDNRNLAVLMPGALVGILLAWPVLDLVSKEVLNRIIGGIAVGFSLFQIGRNWWIKGRPIPHSVLVGLLIGVGTGFVSTLSHVGGVLTTLYLLGQRLDNQRFVGTTTALYFLINLGKLVPYLEVGMMDQSSFEHGLPFYPLVFLGTILGVFLNRRVSSLWFSRLVLASALFTGAKLLLA